MRATVDHRVGCAVAANGRDGLAQHLEADRLRPDLLRAAQRVSIVAEPQACALIWRGGALALACGGHDFLPARCCIGSLLTGECPRSNFGVELEVARRSGAAWQTSFAGRQVS
jgi:hypothetical protein